MNYKIIDGLIVFYCFFLLFYFYFRYKFKNDRTEGIVWIDSGNIYNFNTATILNR